MRGITAITAAWALAACVPSSTLAPARTAEAEMKPTWFRQAQRILVNSGLEIAYADEAAGLLVTSWMTYKVQGAGTRRDRVVVWTTSDTVSVFCQCQEGSAGVQGECELQEEARNLLVETIAAGL
jgi:hypothetical protein